MMLERIASVRDAIDEAARKAGRRSEDVRLLAVSKKQPAAKLRAAYAAGLRDFGENYLQGLEEHAAILSEESEAPRWHFIGHLQSKKAKRAASMHCFHALDSEKLAAKLSSARIELALPSLPCFVQVNISRQDSKSGILPEELFALLDVCTPLEGILIDGLMCIPDPAGDMRRDFAALRELRDAASMRSDAPLRELSMGMSDSLAEAIAEGATIVRVGTALFGARE